MKKKTKDKKETGKDSNSNQVIHIKLEYSELLQSKKDILSLEKNLLKLKRKSQ